MPEKGGRVVFIGNIPYGVTEETITETLGRAGPVTHFRLVYDKDSGRPKGFGFAEFSDSDAAASAVRNLDNYEIMGRKLRVDYSNDGGGGGGDRGDRGDRGGGGGGGAGGYEGAMPLYANGGGGESAGAAASVTAATTGGTGGLPPLPPGAELPPDLTCPNAISRTLSTLPAPQLLDILSQMKSLVMSDPSKATELLQRAPQLSYAIFQALLLLGLVDTTVLSSVVEQAAAGAVPLAMQTQPAPPQPLPQQPQPLPTFAPQQPPPPPPPQQQQQPAQPSRDDLIRQVLSMTPQQVDALDPVARAQIMALRQQFGAAAF